MASISEKLVTVAENTPKVHHAGQLNVVQSAQSLKGSESNTAMLLDDVSPVEHTMGVKVRGKNILPLADSGIYYNGTVGGGKPLIYNSSFAISNFNNIDVSSYKGVYAVIKLTEGETYTLTVNNLVNNCATQRIIYAVGFRSSESTIFGTSETSNYAASSNYNPSSLTFTVPSGYPYCLVGFYNYPTVSGDTVSFNAMQLELGTTATDYTPYVPDLTAVKVTRRGKNLFDISSSRGFESMYAGVTNTINGNEITVTSTANRTVNLLLGTLLKGTYTLSLNASETKQQYIQYGESISTGLTRLDSSNFNSSHTFYISKTRKLWLTTSFGIGETVIFTDIQLELSNTVTDYEPYIAPTEFTPTADGVVNGVTSLYPNTTLMTDTDGVIIDCNYYKDIDKAFNELSSAIALSGGE